VKHIKDPLHGYIDVPEEELSIINTPEFQRLRRIKQLGLSSTVYPEATHTRFAHSLGVMYLAGELADSVDVPEEQVRANQVAGLLHDVGHLPFSHTLEHLLEERANITHEDISCEYVDRISEKKNVVFPVPPENVKSIIQGDADGVNTVANEIDADRLDYLLRDSYNTGINFGRIESETLMKFAQLIDDELGFDHKSLKSVERLLDARMQMNYAVYSHDTVNITENMLTRAVELYLDNTDTTIRNLIGKDDWEIGYELTQSEVEPAAKLFTAVQNRELYKTSFSDPLQDVTAQELNRVSRILTPVHEHEARIAELCGLNRTDVLINPPQHIEVKRFTTPIRTPLGEVRELEDISPKPNALRESSRIHENIHVFTPGEHTEKVREATVDYFETIDELAVLLS